MKCIISAILFAAIVLCANADTAPSDLPLHSCKLYSTGNELHCTGIEQFNLPRLTEILATAPNSLDIPLNVFLWESNIDAFPIDTFTGVFMGSLKLSSCKSSKFPKDLLSQVSTYLKTLVIWSTPFVEITNDFKEFRFAYNLENLDLSGNGIQRIVDSALSNYVSLKSLSLDYNALSELSSNSLAGLSNLRRLSIKGNYITAINSRPFDAQSQLEELYLSYNQIASIDLGQFTKQGKMKTLHLDGNAITELQYNAMQGLSFLKDFALSGNQFKCYCNLDWFKLYLNSLNLTTSSGATCAKPRVAKFEQVQFCVYSKRLLPTQGTTIAPAK